MEEYPTQSLTAKRILVADADDQDRHACLARLRQLGLQAQGVADLKGLSAALAGSDLVITDWGLGRGVDEGVFYLRLLQPWIRPVILFSRQPEHPDREAAGLRHCVAKPDFKLLLKVLTTELMEPALNAVQDAQ